MEFKTRKAYDDLDLKIRMGHLLINVLYIRYNPPSKKWHIRNHCHSSYELHYIPYGKGRLIADGITYSIEPNTFYLTGPHVYHEQRADPNDPMSEFCINFEVAVCKKNKRETRLFVEDEMNEITRTLLDTTFWFGKDQYRSVEIFERVMDELDQQMIGYHTYVGNFISQIIINAVRCYNHQKKANYPLPLKTIDDKRIQILDRLLDSNFQVHLSVDDLAREMKVSRRQLNRIIRKRYATTFHQRVSDLKLSKAKEMLLESKLSVEKISEKVGFASTSYFCRRFKEHTGFTPTQFRTAHTRPM